MVCEEARQEGVVRSSCQARASRSGGRRSLLSNPKHTEVGGSGESCRSANARLRAIVAPPRTFTSVVPPPCNSKRQRCGSGATLSAQAYVRAGVKAGAAITPPPDCHLYRYGQQLICWPRPEFPISRRLRPGVILLYLGWLLLAAGACLCVRVKVA